jgi:signal transduction histidine kinase
LSLPDALREVSRLPPKSIVLYLSLFKDGAGTPYDPHQVAEKVSAAANVPVYGFHDGYMGRGIVGGHMYTIKAQGEEAARLVLRVLNGEIPSNLPLVEGAASQDVFDWRQLDRWQIAVSRLPAGSDVLFRPRSVWRDYRDEALTALAVVVLQTLLILGFLLEHNRRRRAQVALQSTYREVRDLAGRLISAREAERAAIARDLHDDLSQKLAVLAIDVDMLEHDMNGVDGITERVRGVADRARQIGADVHSLSHQLHPANLEIQGLVPALEGLCKELSTPNQLRIDFLHESVPRTISQETALGLFRIAQEALHNVVRHSGAAHATVKLTCEDHTLRLEVSDAGCGFTPGATKDGSLGLVSMRERMQLVGGRLDIQSAPGAGTRVRATAPLDAPTAGDHDRCTG